jgi:cytoskeleton protein RodZ
LTEQALTGVGARLRQAREAAGLGIGDVAHQLRLLPRQIESLEGERFDRLPGPAIARGMVRNYARLLNLDSEALVGSMQPAPEAGVTPRRPTAAPSRAARRRPRLVYAGFFVVLLALIGAVAYEWREERPARESSATVPVPPVLAQAPAVPDQQPAEQLPAPALEAAAPSESPQAKPVKPEPQPAADLPVVSPGLHRLVLRTQEEAWLQVRDGAGRDLVSSLNPPGSERAVRGQPPFQLVIGNAPHVELIYDGKVVDLKPYIRGEVARLTLQ